MKRPLFEGRFYETYYFANIVMNVLSNRFDYLSGLHEFYGDGEHFAYISPFQKYSALHSFIEFMIDKLTREQVDEIQIDTMQDEANKFKNLPLVLEQIRPSSLPINEALNYYDIEHASFEDWLKENGKSFLEATDDDVSEYYNELREEGPYDLLLEKVVPEVFFVIFQNRRVLLLFNDMIASEVASTKLGEIPDEYQQYFASDGKLKRVSIPEWVKKAVYFRDRGLCTNCHRDLSGILTISNIGHYDHIVPLAQGGLNDVSNIQLLCEDCNLKKRDIEASTSDFYEAWYPMDS